MEDVHEALRLACELLRQGAMTRHVGAVAEINRRLKRGRARAHVDDETILGRMTVYFTAAPSASALSNVAVARDLRRRFPELRALLSESQLRQRIGALRKS
jgi:hypothetical protein